MANSTSHEYIPATATDSRSPCPALNSLANHGYLSRDGKNLTAIELISALTNVYKVSYPLAVTLAVGGIGLCGNGLTLDLAGLCQHNQIEHDASLGHRDVDETGGGFIASNKPDPELVQDVVNASNGQVITLENLIQAKFKRETRANITTSYGKPLLPIFSHGELVLVTEIIRRGEAPEVPVEWFKTWFLEERLPDGLNPPHTTGILTLHPKKSEVTRQLAELHAAQAKERRDA